MKIKCLHIFLAVSSLVAACQQPKTTGDNTSNDSTAIIQDTLPAKEKVEVTIDSASNAFAQFLAGLSFDEKIYDAKLKPVFEAHAKAVDKEWAQLDKRILQGLDSFVTEEIEPELDKSMTLFYPYSGPDFLFANHFYPDHPSCILIALEDVGTIPDLNSMSIADLNAYFATLRTALFTPYKYGFYRTKGMEKDFKNKHLNGTIHHILFYLAKEGYQVSKVEGCEYDTDGNRISAPFNESTNFIYIDYYDAEKEELRNISYHSMDASNEGLEKKTPNFTKFIENQTEFYVLMKSASYLMQYDMFSKMKELVMTRGKLIIQDDTGLMFEDINNDDWKVDLYGYYTKTIPLFVQRYQQDLADAYKAMGWKPLPFKIGYNIAHGEYQLMIIRKN